MVTLPSGIDGSGRTRPKMFSPESRMASSSVLQDLRQTVPLQPGYAPCGQTVPGPVAVHVAQARVRALLRRAAGVQRSQGAVLTVGDLSLNTEEQVAIRDGKTVELTAKEYDLIELLMRNPRRVYSRENLMNVVWGYTYAGDYRTVDVHIRRLREKLEKNPAEPDHIMTKWGVGYYFKG